MDKIAFHFGNFTIYWYGVFVAAGFLAGLWTASRRALRSGISGDRIVDLGPWLILGTLVGARLLYVVSYWEKDFAGRRIWELFNIRNGGLVYYGGFIGASAACILYLRLKKLPLWRIADVLAPSIALGYAIGRFGCLMNGCCYGYPTNLPWAVHFPSDHPTYDHGLHPTQIYESALNLGLYGALVWRFRHRQFDGQVFASYLVCYAVLRAFVETFRGDYLFEQRPLDGWLTPAQLVGACILAAGLILLWKLSRLNPVRNPDPCSPSPLARNASAP